MNRAILPARPLSSQKSENDIKSLQWRPSTRSDSRTNLTRDNSRNRAQSASRSINSRPKSAASESFYINAKDNSKGAVITKFPSSKSVRKEVPTTNSIPDKEEILSTKDWLRKYSLLRMKLDLHKLISGPECKHETVSIGIVKKDVSARYCTIFPSIDVKGVIRHLQLKKGELVTYAEQCEKILKRYVKRLQWLLSGSRRLFGTISHRKIVMLIDTSGSMNDHMAELKKELASLIWEQLHKNNTFFNLIRFANRCEKWRENMVEPNEDNCHRAIAWLAESTANGNTCTLDAIKEALDHQGIEAIYLLTDGKPDNSTMMVLEEVKKLNAVKKCSINAISFNCDDQSANEFLMQLSSENNGRYHRSSKSDRDIHLFAHKILTEGVQDSYLARIPDFESDDLKRLATEIKKAKEYLWQAYEFNQLYETKNEIDGDITIGPIHINSTKNDKPNHKDCIPTDFIK